MLKSPSDSNPFVPTVLNSKTISKEHMKNFYLANSDANKYKNKNPVSW